MSMIEIRNLLAQGGFGILPRRSEEFLHQPMICPQCRSVDCFRSHRSGAFDYLSTVLGLRPWRCHSCDLRFHASVVAVSFSGYAHCPRCGNFDLEHISADRVDSGTMITLKRWLAFPAYRCDPCRQRFFSALPFRRILPSTAPAALRKVSTT